MITTVRKILLKEIKQSQKNGRFFSEEIQRRVVKYLEISGESRIIFANKSGVSYGAISNWFRKYGNTGTVAELEEHEETEEVEEVEEVEGQEKTYITTEINGVSITCELSKLKEVLDALGLSYGSK